MRKGLRKKINSLLSRAYLSVWKGREIERGGEGLREMGVKHSFTLLERKRWKKGDDDSKPSLFFFLLAGNWNGKEGGRN